MPASTDRRQNWLGVLAIIVCIGIIWSLLMPVVQGPNRSRRSQCLNNLKNFSLATLNFETIKREYPGYQALFGQARFGLPEVGLPEDSSAKIGSWVVHLLPMLEQQTLRDLWDDPMTNDEWTQAVRGQNNAALQKFYPPLALLNCPVDRVERTAYASTSYVANTGFHLVRRDPALQFEWYASAADDSARSTVSQRAANGVFVNRLGSEVVDPLSGEAVKVFGNAAAVRAADMKDGASQTILFSENCNKLSWSTFSITDEIARSKLGIVWLYAGTSSSDGRPEPLKVIHTMRINYNKGFIGSGPTSARPTSFHPYIVNIAMADGSVRTIDEDIDYRVYQSLMAPHDASSDVPDLDYKLRADDYQR